MIYRLKTLKLLDAGLQKTAYSGKTLLFDTFFLKSMVLWHYLSKFQNDSFKNEVSKHLKNSLHQTDKLMISLHKHGRRDGLILSFSKNY